MSNQPTGYERIHLTINGVDRPVVCDPQKDTLATVIRRMGLTGTKVGCGIGVCGACSIVLNGELCRSCNKKMKNVPEYSEIITIEGIGTPSISIPSSRRGSPTAAPSAASVPPASLYLPMCCSRRTSIPPVRTFVTGSRRTTTSAAARLQAPH